MSGARGPAGRSRSAGGAAPACLFLSFPAAPPSFPLPGPCAGADEAPCDCSCATETPCAAAMARRAGAAFAEAPGFACRRSLTIPGATSLRPLLFSLLGARPAQRASKLLDRRAICCLTYARKRRRSTALARSHHLKSTASLRHEKRRTANTWHPPQRTSSPPPRQEQQ